MCQGGIEHGEGTNQKLIFKESQNPLVTKVRASTDYKIREVLLLFCI